MAKAKMSQAEWDKMLKGNPGLAKQFGTPASPTVKVSRKKTVNKHQYPEPIGPQKPPTLRDKIRGGIQTFNTEVLPALKSARETIIKVRDEGVFAGDGHSGKGNGSMVTYHTNLANLGNDWLPSGPSGKTRKNHHDLVPHPQMMSDPMGIGSDISKLGFGIGGFGEEPRLKEHHKKKSSGKTVHIHHHYHR